MSTAPRLLSAAEKRAQLAQPPIPKAEAWLAEAKRIVTCEINMAVAVPFECRLLWPYLSDYGFPTGALRAWLGESGYTLT